MPTQIRCGADGLERKQNARDGRRSISLEGLELRGRAQFWKDRTARHDDAVREFVSFG